MKSQMHVNGALRRRELHFKMLGFDALAFLPLGDDELAVEDTTVLRIKGSVSGANRADGSSSGGTRAGGSSGGSTRAYGN